RLSRISNRKHITTRWFVKTSGGKSRFSGDGRLAGHAVNPSLGARSRPTRTYLRARPANSNRQAQLELHRAAAPMSQSCSEKFNSPILEPFWKWYSYLTVSTTFRRGIR